MLKAKVATKTGKWTRHQMARGPEPSYWKKGQKLSRRDGCQLYQ
jgi:hypothetical protein